MCKKPMFNINVDATSGNLSYSAKNESCSAVRKFIS